MWASQKQCLMYIHVNAENVDALHIWVWQSEDLKVVHWLVSQTLHHLD